MPFTAASVADQSRKVFVITGGNSGIGLEAAKVLVARNATVVLACRDARKMGEAAASLRAAGAGRVEQVVLDLSSLASVRTAASELASRFPQIDVLVNNAGVMALPERKSADGFELQFATNHLGHFALTGLLLGPLAAAPAGRVVTVSSILHRRGHIVFEDIPTPRAYDKRKSYSMSKLANLLFAFELHRRLEAAGSTVTSLACHPGYSATNLQGAGPSMSGSKVGAFFSEAANALVAQPAAIGALGTLLAATSPEAKGGGYYGSTRLLGLRGYPEQSPSTREANDPEVARRLWEVSEQLTGVRFALEPRPARVSA
ncbi:MAG: SDR family NAD(P)-dependent oxidoreductase [Myxococcaceae bacterium]|nr:SDR family NAD(P)-dependent oxidoreductase [Myxococcaceae bacterium]